LLAQGARDRLIAGALERYESGSVTLWRAADECGLSLWEMVLEARDRGIRVPYSSDELREDLSAL
jgi:predicted HTH domain antitoxin